jgi:hypothetical protein
MRSNYFRYLTFLILMISDLIMNAQDWECAKERDGIKIFTCQNTASSYKIFRGEIDLQTDVNTVSNLIEDVRNFDEWDDDISLIKILDAEPGKFLRYYVQYNLPWPIADRDLCVEAKISTDSVTGERIISSQPDPEAIPEDPEFVRIKKYWQKWTISPAGAGKLHLTLEGFADPAGDIPAWLANLAITKAPWNMLQKIREALNN